MSEVGHLAHEPGLAGGPPPVGGKPRPNVLTINGGSSSLKFAVYPVVGPSEPILSGRVERIGRGESRLVVNRRSAALEGESHAALAPDQTAAAMLVIEQLPTRSEARRDRGRRAPGRPRRSATSPSRCGLTLGAARSTPANRPTRSRTPARRNRAHRNIRQHIPGVPQVACFDTGFPPHNAQDRPDRADPAQILGTRHPSVWVPRALLLLSHGGAGADRRFDGGTGTGRPGEACGSGAEPGGGARGPMPGHDDGVHSRIRPGHGNAKRRHRPKFECVPRQRRTG